MTVHSKNTYLDPTYPAYYENFNRPKTFLCFSIRQLIYLITMIDIIFSVIGLCFALIYLIFDQMSSMEIFQSNEFIQNLRYVPIGIFFNNRILFQSFWTIDFISKNLPIIFYIHILFNSLSLIGSVYMLTAIKYKKPYHASIYWVYEFAYFIHMMTMFVRWITNNENESNNIRLFYGNGDLGFFTNDLNIFCLVLLEFVWKTFKLILIFRSIQYLRDYYLHQSCSNSKNDNQTLVIIHVIPNKQFDV